MILNNKYVFTILPEYSKGGDSIIMTYSQNDYIIYRIQKAEETYSDSILLVDHERYNSAVNRLYYACFYIVSALLTTKGLQASTHNGAKILTALTARDFRLK